jgi:S1-C subfamily serine protease
MLVVAIECGSERPDWRRNGAAIILGAMLEPLDRVTAASLAVPSRNPGLVITSLRENRPAAESEMRTGGLLERIDGIATRSLGDAAAALKRASAPGVVMTLNRHGHYANVRMPIRPTSDTRGRGEQGVER